MALLLSGLSLALGRFLYDEGSIVQFHPACADDALMSGSWVLRLKRPDRCIRCDAKLAVGEKALWDGEAKTVTCISCASAGKSEAAKAHSGDHAEHQRGAPGASAQREFERRHDARIARARSRYGAFGGGIAWLAGDPSSTRSWQTGAEGEMKVAARLEKLLKGKDVELLHDRLMPGSRRANIDHIAVGPGGVTVIDSKNMRGKVRVETSGGLFKPRRATLRIKGSDRTRLVRKAQEQAEALRDLLAMRQIHLDVRAALCFASPEGLPWLSRLEVDGVLIAGPARVAKLSGRPGTLSAEQRQRVLDLLSAQLRLAA